MSEQQHHIVLSIAGFDPCAGAGVLADIQTLQRCKVDGMAVVTAITSQNEDEILHIKWESISSIEHQLHALFKKYTFDVVKIGIIKSLSALDLVIDRLVSYSPEIKIIWDPILRSSSGFDFIKKTNAPLLHKILDRIFLITPNLSEYEQLKSILSLDTRKYNLLLKGGHTEGNDTSDILIDNKGHETQILGHRIGEKTKHGTGCVLSSAIAAGLHKGMKLKTACTFGKRYVEEYLKSGTDKLGAHYQIEL